MSQSSWALVSSWAKCRWSWWHSSSQCLYLILSGKSGYSVGIKNVLEANKYCLSFFSFLFCDEFAPSPTCRRKWQPSPLLLPGESHGQRSLVGYSPWGHKHWMHLSDSHKPTCMLSIVTALYSCFLHLLSMPTLKSTHSPTSAVKST